jgi:hypothetical protein
LAGAFFAGAFFAGAFLAGVFFFVAIMTTLSLNRYRPSCPERLRLFGCELNDGQKPLPRSLPLQYWFGVQLLHPRSN